MFHLIWYILVGLIAGVIAKSVMHPHMTLLWTIVLGIIGSIIGGAVTHMFSRPTNERYHPAGLIFSTLGAILVLFICYKLKIRFPHIFPISNLVFALDRLDRDGPSYLTPYIGVRAFLFTQRLTKINPFYRLIPI
jgi:uncharacterized membrane protein YeaQ/YmgE (transglycosylase-associated protein family)